MFEMSDDGSERLNGMNEWTGLGKRSTLLARKRRYIEDEVTTIAPPFKE